MRKTDYRLQFTVLILLFLPLFGWGCEEEAVVLPPPPSQEVAPTDSQGSEIQAVKIPEGRKVYENKDIRFFYPDGFTADLVYEDENVVTFGIHSLMAGCQLGEPHCGPDVEIDVLFNLQNKSLEEFLDLAGPMGYLFRDAIEGYHNVIINGYEGVEFQQVVGESTERFVIVISAMDKIWKITLDADSPISDSGFRQIVESLFAKQGGAQ